MKTRIERMKHRRPLPLEFLEDRNLLSPVIPSPAAEVQHDHVTVPFKMTFDGVRSIVAVHGTFPPGPVDFKLEADGNATHWGRFHLFETHTLTATDQGLEITGGQATFTLANGDIVTATYTGTAHVLPTSPNPSLEVDLTYTITAVTGRNKGEPGDTFQLTLLTDPNYLLTTTDVPVTATGSGYITK